MAQSIIIVASESLSPISKNLARIERTRNADRAFRSMKPSLQHAPIASKLFDASGKYIAP